MASATGTYIGADGQTYQQGQTSHTPVSTVNTPTPNQTQTSSGSSAGTYVGADGQTYQQGAGYLGPVSKPAPAVFSDNKAANFMNYTIAPTIANGMAGITAQNDKNAQGDLTHFLPGETAEAYNQRVASVNSAKNGGNPAATSQVDTTTPADKAAHQIANTPETGNQFVYDGAGQRTELPIGSAIPAGYSATPPNPQALGHSPVNQYTTSTGQTVTQYSDGSYGFLGLDGTYQGAATVNDFNSAKSDDPNEVIKSIAQSIASLKNGPIPLTAPQQAQIDAVNGELASAVQAQAQANANLTGGTTVAMNLYGMGNSVSGMGIIKGTVDSGIAKILDLQTKAAASIAAMEESFDKDNYQQLFQQYTAYESAMKDVSSHIDQMRSFAQQTKQQIYEQVQKPINDAVAEMVKNGAPAAVVKAAQGANNVNQVYQIGAGYFQDPTSPGGMYSQYVSTAKDKGQTPMSAADFMTALDYKKAYAEASAQAKAKAVFDNSTKNQENLEQQGRQVILKEVSNRSGGLGLQDGKVNQAIHLQSLLNQYKTTQDVPNAFHLGAGNPFGTHKETVYNIPPGAYTDLAIGLANLLSPTGVAAEGTVNAIKQKTAAGDINGAISYITGEPKAATTNAMFETLADSVDRQGTTAEQERQTYLDSLAAVLPTDLSADRKASLLQGQTLNSYTSYKDTGLMTTNPSTATPDQIAATAKNNVQNFVQSNPDKAQMITDMMNVPGASYTTVAQKMGLIPSP